MSDTPRVLRIDAPAAVRRHEKRRDSPLVFLTLVMGGAAFLAALVVLVIAWFAPDGTIGALMCGTVVAAYLSLLGWLGYWEQRRDPWLATVRLGDDAESLIVEAHRVYWALSAEARDRALELVCTMYRIAEADVRGAKARDLVEHRLARRLWALRDLLHAEDRLRMATDALALDDTTDLDTSTAWRQAMDQVEDIVRQGD